MSALARWQKKMAVLESKRRNSENLKREVFTKYSGKGRAQCSVLACRVRDLRTLQLDHIKNNGKRNRVATNGRGGQTYYRKLKKAGYPAGYQTVCANHHALITWRRCQSAESVLTWKFAQYQKEEQ